MSATLTPDRPPAADNGAYLHQPAGPPRPTDQDEFDAAVDRNAKLMLQVMGGVAVLAALVMSTIALVVSTGKSNTGAMMMPAIAAVAPASPITTATSPLIDLTVAGANKKGPDGKLHDSFSQTDFAVKVGQPTRLRINNTDSGPHSITSAATGVSITVLPGIHTYTMVAARAGRFEWICVIPCDSDAHGWAMTHPGYMAGYITAT